MARKKITSNSSDCSTFSSDSTETDWNPAGPSVTTPQTPDLPTFSSSIDFEEANVLALEEGNSSAIVKEELKFSILHRRYSSGQGDRPIPIVLEKIETGALEQNKEDGPFLEERRAKNKEAAQKCRKKQKEKMYSLMQEELREEGKEKSQRYEIEKLREEKERLEEILKMHEKSLNCKRRRIEGSARPYTFQSSTMTFL
ncbi:cyclic AMP-dependent transcription factor ATF-3-like [Lingula anatina]|uniref:Cyclic AMP-dependent transcription factor ATF-3-like n=1 Tax=Lingula anatina TaxID=7574 RepID=A0A1S3HFX5_LINAN|nr:cyclic AMP-dependent transcription factor ATF-3-like [Lingula anatina]|eukprot:XP_013384983.1 cyclic AMP-dependent transcription factor ATF-3-like [Lingula anatina]